jgi:hypothetical protein
MELKTIQSKIYEIRGQKVMLDYDLSNLYAVQTKVLNQAVKRNRQRFPIDFMFRLTKKEWERLDPQEMMIGNNRSQIVTSLQKYRSRAASPYAFTEQGVAMLSSVLRSKKAVNVNIAIMRAFVFIRQYALSHKDLTQKLKDLESKYDRQFKNVYDAINFLIRKDKLESEQKTRKRIGFKSNKEN